MNRPRRGAPQGRRRYPSRRKPQGKETGRRPSFTPAADPQLKKVFAGIGVPKNRPFRPDRFQTEAVAVMTESDCLVTAPTGAGKTWIAVEAIRRIFDRGGRAWYASPLKALTNAKLIEFSEIFRADNVGILTGDRKEQPDAPIIVGTTEILRNQLYDAMHRGASMQKDHNMRRCLSASFASFAIAGLSPAVSQPALAQTAQLEEIVVTARKREERLQELPLSVTAIDAARIERLGIRNLQDIAQFTPGVNLDNAFGLNDQRPARL